MTDEEMRKIGMVERSGYWVGKEMPIAAIAQREISSANAVPATTVAVQPETSQFEATA
jgi:hypothetical protein